MTQCSSRRDDHCCRVSSCVTSLHCTVNYSYSQVRRVDGQLDRVHLVPDGIFTSQSHMLASSARISELQSVIKALSTTSSSSPLLSSWRILALLNQVSLSELTLYCKNIRRRIRMAPCEQSYSTNVWSPPEHSFRANYTSKRPYLVLGRCSWIIHIYWSLHHPNLSNEMLVMDERHLP
jgi:hypothetical protein